MSAVRQPLAASRTRLPEPIDEVPQAPPADAAANDDTAPPLARTFAIDGDPLFGMAIASVILFALFAALLASF